MNAEDAGAKAVPPTHAARAQPSPPPRRAIPIQPPPFRRLNTYAFDPSLSLELENVAINRATLALTWERDLKPGPVGDYLEVVDVDPASGCFYAPVDLNNNYLLAQDGLAPSEGNPQFHQQMVYAVAMTTIKNFEHALGREALWSPHYRSDVPPGAPLYEYVARLRIYPHALREANAYYSPQKKALLFGYFPAPTGDVRFHLPGGMVFCCLSHDVVAHETTHALLDGMHRRFIEPSNVDVLAFHEAFADICALLQHFSLAEVLRQQIAKTRGDLSTNNLLAQLAQEFGQATGLHGALRNALGGVNTQTGKWERARPDPQDIQTVTEPHMRGSLLVAAIFQAFISIYEARTRDLFRLASGGTGILPQGALPPDLINRLATEAAKSAQHVLTMCIRALDYCPPVDPTFGDYLRAMITADADLVPDDDRGYRVAMIEAFRQYGIYPLGLRSISADSLRWQAPLDQDFSPRVLPVLKQTRRLAEKQGYTSKREWLYAQQESACRTLHGILLRTPRDLIEELGLDMSIARDGQPVFEVHSARPLERVGPDGQTLNNVIIEVTQRRPIFSEAAVQAAADAGQNVGRRPDFWFRGGATLVVDLESGQLCYAITKNIRSETRLARERDFRGAQTDSSLRAMYFGGISQETREPFAFLHRMGR